MYIYIYICICVYIYICTYTYIYHTIIIITTTTTTTNDHHDYDNNERRRPAESHRWCGVCLAPRGSASGQGLRRGLIEKVWLQSSPRSFYFLIRDPMRSSSFFLWCPWIRDISYREPFGEKNNREGVASNQPNIGGSRALPTATRQHRLWSNRRFGGDFREPPVSGVNRSQREHQGSLLTITKKLRTSTPTNDPGNLPPWTTLRKHWPLLTPEYYVYRY